MTESRSPESDSSRAIEADRAALEAVKRRLAAQNAELESAAEALKRMQPSFALSDAAGELVSAIQSLDDGTTPRPRRNSPAAPPMFGTRC